MQGVSKRSGFAAFLTFRASGLGIWGIWQQQQQEEEEEVGGGVGAAAAAAVASHSA